MKISTKGRYAVRMLLDIAEHQDNGCVSLNDVSKRQNISKKYLEQIVFMLNRPDILQTTRGYRGGYKLAKPANRYTIGDILRITEGSLEPVSCLEGEGEGCERADSCITLPVWQGLSKVINEYLDSITLQDLLDKKKETYEYDYII
ncbi:MAG: Rrf2 family transcriptional regulator [Clostridia bacterium]|nr:Rrf2 family transcriptional regulator [Clostridia bacterium]